ncbi:MAG: hypothetical protein IPK16_30745 [Anaerolineales bacterium]|nr:hypothetical protein [Anaerolineales bacterium]
MRVNVGDGMQIATNALTLSLATDPALEYSSGAVRVKVSDGIARSASGIAVDLATNPGLEFATAKLRVKTYHGLELSSNGVGVKLKSGMTAMAVDADGLYIADAIAGAGLTIDGTTKVMAVGAGDGIDVNANDVAVDVTDIINVAYGLYEPSANDIGINIAGSTGLTFTVGNALSLGAPSSLSVSSSNHVTSTTHGHAVTTSTDVGTTPAAAIPASNSSGAS